jgi:hypothetical protein
LKKDPEEFSLTFRGLFFWSFSKRVAITMGKMWMKPSMNLIPHHADPLLSGERIKVRGKIKHKKSGFLQVVGFYLLSNIVCNQNGEEPILKM